MGRSVDMFVMGRSVDMFVMGRSVVLFVMGRSVSRGRHYLCLFCRRDRSV